MNSIRNLATPIFILTLLLLSGCSREPKSQFSIELVVDGRTVLKESTEGKKIDRSLAQHHELMHTVERACNFARFIHQQVAVNRTAPSSVSAKIGKPTEKGNTLFESQAETSLSITPLNGQVMLCSSAADSNAVMPGECRLQPATASQPQPQYGLEAKSFLEARYGMKTAAFYVTRTADESRDGDRQETTDEVRITGDRLSCKSSLRGQGLS